MAKAVIATLADEVVDHLNKKSGAFAQGYTAQRTYRPTIKLEDTDTLHVTVAIAAITENPDSRAEWLRESAIDIGVQYRADPKAGTEPIEKFDDYLLLTEQIHDEFKTGVRTKLSLSNAVLTAAEYGGPLGLPYVPEHISEFKQFTGVVRLTFRQYRS